MRPFFARLAGTALALVVFEAIIRQTYTQALVWEPGYGYVLAPGSTVVWGREGHGKSHWTANGLRGLAPRTEPHPILALGDSFTEGLQVDDAEVFPAVLERELRDRGIATPVFNAGRSSTSVADYVAFAPRYRERFSPRWILVQVTDSDFLEDAWDPAKTHFRSTDGALSAEVVLPPPRGRAGAFLWDLRQRVMLVGAAFIRGGELAGASAREPPLFRAGASPPPPKAPVERPVEAELDLLFEAYDGRVTLLYLPSMNPRKPLERSAVEERVFAHCARVGRSCVSTRPGFPAFLEEGRSPYGHPNSEWNAGHMNAAGHRLAARSAADELARLGRDGLL